MINDEHGTDLMNLHESMASLQEEKTDLNFKLIDNREEIIALNFKLEQLESPTACQQKVISIEKELKHRTKYFYDCQSDLASYRPMDMITTSFSGKMKKKLGEEVGQKQIKI